MPVVSLQDELRRGAKELRRSIPWRPPRVFIIDHPKACLVAAILVAIALAGTGALIDELLSMPRDLICDAPPGLAPQ
jgi:hypothetical protein